MSRPLENEDISILRLQKYIEKIATGPKQSKDLTSEEAEDGLSLILSGKISPVRSAIFLVSARMKRETLEENKGFWRALDSSCVRREVKLKRLLQVADPFDGFKRIPYFGFYAIPVVSMMGLPCYGHSAQGLPPKFGATFDNILREHYGVSGNVSLESVIQRIEKDGFGYVGLHQSHPQLEKLRDLRIDMVKRTVLSTFEKMLMPLKAETENVLATTYFHKGYETSMIAIARLSAFDKLILGNGLESTTLFGAHKKSVIFNVTKRGGSKEITVDVSNVLDEVASQRVSEAYKELKGEKPVFSLLAEFGERALRNGSGPAAPLIAWQAGCLAYFSGRASGFPEGFAQAEDILKSGRVYPVFMEHIRKLNQ